MFAVFSRQHTVCLSVAHELFPGTIKSQLASEPVRNVCHVTQRSRQMSSLDIGRDVFGSSGAKGINEVDKMRFPAGASEVGGVGAGLGTRGSGAGLVLSAEEGLPGIAAAIEAHPALGTEEEIADSDSLLVIGVSALVIGVSAADLELQDFAVGVFKSCDLGVSCLLVTVREAEVPTATIDFDGMLVFVYTPTRDVHLVDALVADVTIARIPEPVPLVMEAIFVKSLIVSRSEPQVVMYARWDRAVRDHLPAVTELVAKALRHIDFSESAVVDEFHCL